MAINPCVLQIFRRSRYNGSQVKMTKSVFNAFKTEGSKDLQKILVIDEIMSILKV
jgi:hypothetical protein